MEPLISKDPIVEKIVNGDPGDEIIELLLDRNLPLKDEEYLESLVFVIPQKKFSERAGKKFMDIPAFVKLGYIKKKEANHNVARFILTNALHKDDSEVLIAAINNQALPVDILMMIAEQGSFQILTTLLENQIKMIAYPEIMEAIEKNSSADSFVKGKITEIRDYYLKVEETLPISKEEILEDLQDIADSSEIKEILEEVEANDLIENVTIEQKTISTLEKINKMRLPDKVKLALEGTKTERMILLRDPSKIVVKSVLSSPKISEDEVAIFLKIKSIDKEFIEKIAKSKEWTKKYSIVIGLVHNPKAPVTETMRLVRNLHQKDLTVLSRDRNTNPVIMKFAKNLLNQRQGIK
ncbi:MAG: hypothetical protein KAS21_03390 [Candidatus Aminicenantes bacterium]|nr:hypothetical protein [Candidatus Aminicenantes bacterium]